MGPGRVCKPIAACWAIVFVSITFVGTAVADPSSSSSCPQKLTGVNTNVNRTEAGNKDICISSDDPNFLSDGVVASHSGTGDIRIDFDGGSITTQSDLSGQGHGINAKHVGIGDIRIDVSGMRIGINFMSSGTNNHGIWGEHSGSRGDVIINIEDKSRIDVFSQSTGSVGYGVLAKNTASRGRVVVRVADESLIETKSNRSYGIYGWNGTSSEGGIDINLFKNSGVKTSGTRAHGIYAWAPGSGDIDINIGLESSKVETNGDYAVGIRAQNYKGAVNIKVYNMSEVKTTRDSAHGILGSQSTWNARGDIRISLESSEVNVEGEGSWGIWGFHEGSSGDIDIWVSNRSSVTTKKYRSFGIIGWQQGSLTTGNITIIMDSSTVKTEGEQAHGVYGLHFGTEGDIRINLDSSTITTKRKDAHGVYAGHKTGNGRIMVVINGTNVKADGVDASGVQVGRFSSSDKMERMAKIGTGDLRQQTVIVGAGSSVSGGSEDDAAGVYLVGGGRVVIRGNGYISALSGIAIRSARKKITGLDVDPVPNLRVELHPGGLDIWDRLRGNLQGNLPGKIVNDGGHTVVTVHDRVLYDSNDESDTPTRWVPNGFKDFSLNTDFTDMQFGNSQYYDERNTVRPAIYESLPGVMLRLDGAGVSGTRFYGSGEPTWIRLSGVRGSYRPSVSSQAARYTYDGHELAAGVELPLQDGLTAGMSVRRVSGEADVWSSANTGEINIKGHGLAGELVWHDGHDYQAAARVSATRYGLGYSSTVGTIAHDADASVVALGAEAVRTFKLADSTVAVRTWLDHAKASMDPLTDGAGLRISITDGTRTAVGMGIAGQSIPAPGGGGWSNSWSLGLERQLTDETVTQASGTRLVSRGPSTRFLLDLGLGYRFGGAALSADLSAAGYGSGDHSVSTGVRFDTRF